jgi:hypothetical protein
MVFPMYQNVLTLSKQMAGGRVGLAVAALALALGFTSCKDASEPVPPTETTYYPVAVGNFWVYAVADTTWSAANVQGSQVTPSVATGSSFQFRETVTGSFTDAAGKTAYRLTRAKRLMPNDAWRDDSVFVLSPSDQSVILNRNNARTVELIFPAREGRSWNLNAFNNNSKDTISAETRQYGRVGQPFITGGGTTGLPATTYATTVTTTNTNSAAENTLLRRISYRQVFAAGVGPVFRRRVHLEFFNYTNQSTGIQEFPKNSFFSAFTRRETLLDYGPR